MNWLAFLTRSKGTRHLFRRMQAIFNRYGMTTARMTENLNLLNDVLIKHNCNGSFPITAIAMKRNPKIIQSLAEQGMEFAIHGYVHVDHSQLPLDVQRKHLNMALEVFKKNNVICHGFRSPYLHWNDGTIGAIQEQGLNYVSNRPVLWDVVNEQTLDQDARAAYNRVVDFYSVWQASENLSIPELSNDLVRIPVSLPDDEMLIERLRFTTTGKIEKVWRSILQQIYDRGELFTLSLHPERTGECYQALSNVLADAQARTPAIWIAQLRDITEWWRTRRKAQIEILDAEQNSFQVQIQGPKDITTQ